MGDGSPRDVACDLSFGIAKRINRRSALLERRPEYGGGRALDDLAEDAAGRRDHSALAGCPGCREPDRLTWQEKSCLRYI